MQKDVIKMQHFEDRLPMHASDPAKLSSSINSSEPEKVVLTTFESCDGRDPTSLRAIAERKLVRKQDFVIIPLAVCLYLSAYLGSARLQGLEKEVLDNDDTKYSIALSCFFITYVVFSIPGTMLAKATSPSTSISIGALIWSIAASCQAAATSPTGFYVARLFVGIGEALFGQAMSFHLSLWYTKKELARRVGLFISAGATAGAFSGLIAYGVAHLENTSLQQWRILEGLPSLLLAITVFFCLPTRPATSKFLNEQERKLARLRLEEQSSFEVSCGIEWSGVRRAFKDWKTYVFAVMFSCMNLTLGSVGGFLPTIVKGLGYTAQNAQLLTVPPYLAALVCMLFLSTFSDRKQSRGLPVALVFGIGLVGWGLLYVIPAHGATYGQLHARYFACICIVMAGYSAIPIIVSWVSANTGNESQRVVALGMLNTIGQALAILAAFSFPSKQGPQYREGILINLSFQALGLLIALFLTLYFRLENRRRNELEGTPLYGTLLNTREEFDLATGFRYVM
ncbi:BQ5605_C020g09174 [Microbotryum silenes-dioicae]|uniref:BQ5605_C020g09174 protein n=1 Tax=Microbotryum silenes-dioicae TaxID=796604 RepID=A0A2X0PKJ1_9BASI|nr:BQ5605_C020g09174 [Microbotryum silenes-dioicae]